MTKETTQQAQTATPQQTAVAKFENIADKVLAKIEKLQGTGDLHLPKNYAVENHLKAAWLVLQETEDRNHVPALTCCTRESIANALYDMVLQGLSVAKKQGYFIVYGNKLEFQRSYFGTVALAKSAGGLKSEPVANVVYEGDDFVYTIDPETGGYKIVQHNQVLDNIDNTKIKGAYAILTLADGSKSVTIMSMQQIRASWNQGATKGTSPAHKNFAEEMAKKTVIGRACKMLINSSSDAWIYEGKRDEEEVDKSEEQRKFAQSQTKESVVIDLSDAIDVTDVTPTTAPQPEEEEGPGY